MFFTIYKATVRNLFRSPLFWMMFALFGFVAFNIVTSPTYGYYVPELNETIMDTDPRFVLKYNTYVQHIANTVGQNLLLYALPLFTVVSVVLILNRDYGDNFFEIEKAAGMKPTQYLFGRLAALVTVNFIVAVVMGFLFLHLYVGTRGGVAELELWNYIADSTVRMMRHLIFRALPAVLFYIGFTYLMGSLFRSGVAAALCSIGYAVFYVVMVSRLRFRLDPFYFNYLSPNPSKLSQYLHYYDSEWFENIIASKNTSLGKAALCVCILVGLAVVYSAIAYLRTRTRDR